MFQIQPREDFYQKSFSVLSDGNRVVAVMRDEVRTQLFAHADDLRNHLMVAVVLLEKLAPGLYLEEFNELLIQTGEKR